MLIGFDVARISKRLAGVGKLAENKPNAPIFEQKLLQDTFQRSHIRFGSDTPAGSPTPEPVKEITAEPANLNGPEFAKLQDLLPGAMRKNLQRAIKPFWTTWVRFKLEEGQAPVLVYKEGEQLKETKLQGVSKLLTANDLSLLKANLDKAIAGPDGAALQTRFKNAVEFPPEILEVPLGTEPALLTTFQTNKLHELLPASMANNLDKSVKPHRTTWVRLKLEVGKMPIFVYKEAGVLKEAEFGGTAKPLRMNDLWTLHTKLEKGFDGPDSKMHLRKLRSVLEFVNLDQVKEAVKAEEAERKKIRGDAATYLVSLLPFKFQPALKAYLDSGQKGVLQKIRISHNMPLQIRYEDAGGYSQLNTPKFTREEVEEIRNNVLKAQEMLDRVRGRREDDDVNVKGPLRKLLPLFDIEGASSKPKIESVPGPVAKEPFTLEETDLPILLADLLPGALGDVMNQVPASLRQHIHGIKIAVNQPITVARNNDVIATGSAPVTLTQLNEIEQTLESLQSRPQKTEADDPASFKRAYVRLKALIGFDRVVKGGPSLDSLLPDPAVKLMQKEDFDRLMEVLPPTLKAQIDYLGATVKARIEDIRLDLNRPVVVQAGDEMFDLDTMVTTDDLQAIMDKVGKVGPKERSGLAGTLHRISPIVNPGNGHYTGMTIRVGRVIDADISPILGDLNAGKSLLLLGEPGAGKTTKLRKIARHLSLQKMLAGKPLKGSVMVVDTSNEIGGDGDEPHRFLGRARRLQVPSEEKQYEVMRRAIQNHSAKVVIIDEIGSEAEAQAASVIARNGGMLVATAHGNDFEQLINNKELQMLVGSPEKSTISDALMIEKGLESKTQKYRPDKPPFDTLLVMKDRFTAEYYPDLAKAVDDYLRGRGSKPMIIQFKPSV